VESRLVSESLAWRSYLELDAALCAHYFTGDNSGQPLYLDVEEDDLAACGESVGLTGEEFLANLVTTTRALFSFGESRTPILKKFEAANRRWFQLLREARRFREQHLPPPPTIGLLCLFVIPAEHMGADGGRGGSHQRYYPPLYELLQIEKQHQKRFESSYRHTSEELWLGLNAWLEFEDGRYGLPTAFSLSHRYVGLPVSQALIRDTERRQLRRMFAQYGLNPQDALSSQDMSEWLGEWITGAPSPASRHLQALWKNLENREHVSTIALRELAGWDGYGFEAREGKQERIASAAKSWLFLADQPDGLFNTRMGLGISIKASEGLAMSDHRLATTDGDVSLPFSILKAGLIGTTASEAGLEPRSLLEGKVSIRTEEKVRDRYPRKISPFELDYMSNLWLEVESVELGGKYRFLVHHDLLKETKTSLALMAQDGFSDCDLAGVPDGWTLITDIVIIGPPPRSVSESQDYDLSALRAKPATRMKLTGGLRLPGRIERHSLLAMPQLLVTSDNPEPLSISIVARDVYESERKLVGKTDPQVAPFEVKLEDFIEESGDYELLLLRTTTAVQSLSLRVRTANEPDQLGWNSFEYLSHGTPDDLWALRSLPASDLTDVIVSGAVSFGPCRVVEDRGSGTILEVPEPERSWDPPARLVVQKIPDNSCVITGKHHLRLPTYNHTQKAERWVWGECDGCGMRKRSPSDHKSAERLKVYSQQAKTGGTGIDVASFRPIQHQEQTVEFSAAIDAITYLGRGSISAAHQIARSLENTAIFEKKFIQQLEALAFIEVRRDERLEPQSFELAPTSAITTSDESVTLVGPWLQDNLALAAEATEKQGGTWMDYEVGDTVLRSLSGITLDQLKQSLRDDFSYLERAGRKLLDRLPPLSEIGAALHRQSFYGSDSLRFFMAREGVWRKFDDEINLPGAYVENAGFRRQYFWRSDLDVARSTAALADPYTIKHLAALAATSRLCEFDKKNDELSMQLGCDLPGLFNRAAVLEGGLLPLQQGHRLVYRGISAAFAEVLLSKLSA